MGSTNIVIIRPGAIGDTLLTFPVIEALKVKYAPARIVLVGNAAVLPLARALGIVEETADYEATQWSELFASSGIRTPSLLTLLHHTDLAICWLRDTEGLVAHNLRDAGVKQVITAPGRSATGERIHETEYLARTIEVQIDAEHLRYRLPLSYQASSQAKPLLNATIAIHPGSGGASKCWPVANFATIITWLWERAIPVLLLAGYAEEERLTALCHALPPMPQPHLLTLLANAPLLTVAAQVQQCKGYLGNDSGITHLATLLGVPTIALFGPSDPSIWHPQGPAVRILQASNLGNLQPDVVISALQSLYP